jgi:hypothetical protein
LVLIIIRTRARVLKIVKIRFYSARTMVHSFTKMTRDGDKNCTFDVRNYSLATFRKPGELNPGETAMLFMLNSGSQSYFLDVPRTVLHRAICEVVITHVIHDL